MNSFDTDHSSDRRSFFDRVYTAYWDKVINDAYKRLGNADQAEDIAQEVFTQLWRRCGRPEPIEDMAAYLFISTRNAVFRHFELQKRRASIPELLPPESMSAEGADSNLVLKEFTEAFQAMVDVLPPQQRMIFRMKYEEELNSQEIAQLLNVSPKTVRNQIGRALSSLKKSLSYMPLLLMFSAI